jgi:trehalose 6-phosphate synthase
VGGLVTALTGALKRSGGLWIASAMSEEDREHAEGGWLDLTDEGANYSLRYLSFEPPTYDAFYNGISNRVLWFLHHYLWDVAATPRFDAGVRGMWDAYREVNQGFARALADEGIRLPGTPSYLIQDYHLSLAPDLLRRMEPSARIVYFSHIPFAGPMYLQILPRSMREELLGGILGADLIGFHTGRWADSFLLSCRELSGARVDLRRKVVRWRGRTANVGVYPISIDVLALQDLAAGPAVTAARKEIEEWRGEARLIVRVDRAELSKNVLRGFDAYEDFLTGHPEWHGRVKFLALLTPSREAIPEYGDYLGRCAEAVSRIAEKFGRPGWDPLRMEIEDDLPRSIAGYLAYDVLLVNPVLDGMNLVAKEGPVVNDREGVLVLSENAGAAAELGGHALVVNPFDIAETSEALARALDMEPGERARRSRGLRAAIARSPLDRWVPRQLEDLDRVTAGYIEP